MSSKLPSTAALLRTWVSASRHRGVPVPSSSVIERRLFEALAAVRTAGIKPEDFASREEVLSVLSLLSVQLAQAREPSERVLGEAAAGFKCILTLDESSDEFNERAELLARFGFICWRHSRLLGRSAEAEEWLEKYEIAFALPSVSRECLLLRLEESGANAGKEDLLDAGPEGAFGLLAYLRQCIDLSPSLARERALAVYRLLEYQTRKWEDPLSEAAYFLGEAARAIGGASRVLGRCREAAEWFATSKQHFLAIQDEAALANLAYSELTLQVERRSYECVLARARVLAAQCLRHGLTRVAMKCEFVNAFALKEVRRISEAASHLEALREKTKRLDHPLRAFVLVTLAEIRVSEGRYPAAEVLLREADETLRRLNYPVVLAHVRGVIAEAFRDQGRLRDAATHYREAIEIYASEGVFGKLAYTRVVLAETLIAMGQHEEAELEILAALPTIEAEQMKPEAGAAVTLLRESIRRRKMDRNALRELREQLRGRA